MQNTILARFTMAAKCYLHNGLNLSDNTTGDTR